MDLSISARSSWPHPYSRLMDRDGGLYLSLAWIVFPSFLVRIHSLVTLASFI